MPLRPKEDLIESIKQKDKKEILDSRTHSTQLLYEGIAKAVAKPDVFNHNIETTPSLYTTIRPGARYFHSLWLLKRVKELNPLIFTKSGLMVGLGETKEQI